MGRDPIGHAGSDTSGHPAGPHDTPTHHADDTRAATHNDRARHHDGPDHYADHEAGDDHSAGDHDDPDHHADDH